MSFSLQRWSSGRRDQIQIQLNENENENEIENENDIRKKEQSTSLLYLNVYDLTPLNKYLYWIGLGIFHSGIQVHDMEYGFGAHDYPSSGVFEVEPRSCPGFVFRKSILVGTTEMSHSEFRSFMQYLASRYHGDTYHLIAKNCNHFTDEVCRRLTGKPIPGWVNRLARLASFFNCLLPEHVQIDAVRQHPDHTTLSGDGSESGTSSASFASEEEELLDDPDLHLLNTPGTDIAFVQEKPIRLARELLNRT